MSISSPVARDDRPAVSPPPEREAPPAGAVVVGVDGSRCGLAAVRWAARTAAARSAPLRIVHAATYLGRPGTPGALPPELPRARKIAAAAYTEARHAAPHTPVEADVVPDGPATALLDADADGQLLVLGISTTGASDELVLAPLAQQMATRATHPVVVVPRRQVEADGRPVVAVLGLGEPADDEAVAGFAAETARCAHRPLSLLRTRSAGADAGQWAERFPDLEVHTTALRGDSAVDLLDAACPTPLLVLSAGRDSRFHHGLDRRRRWLLRHSTSPLALVPPAQRSAG